MVVFSRAIGESLVFDRDYLLTLNGVEPGQAWLTLSRLSDPEMVKTLDACEGQPVEITPEVRVTLLPVSANLSTAARFGIECPRNMPVHRREILDA